jgi:hypothetical protein
MSARERLQAGVAALLAASFWLASMAAAYWGLQ